MKAARIGLVIAVALACQTTLVRFLVGDGAGVDLVLIVVVFTALSGGPVVGLWTGTAGGLAQDVLSAGIVGISGLSKSIIGFCVGIVGAKFILARIRQQLVVLAAATTAHVFFFAGVYALLGPSPVVTLTDVLTQVGSNAVVGIVVVTAVEYVPSLWERGRQRRSGFARRRWRTS